MTVSLTSAILGLGPGVGAATVQRFLEMLLGPAIEGAEAPLIAWRDLRLRNAIELADRAAELAVELAAESDEDIHAVPNRLLVPILERGSLEDDSEVREKWAHLLANSAVNPERVLPAFVVILTQLSPLDVRILDYIHPLCRLRNAMTWLFKGTALRRAQEFVESRLNIGAITSQVNIGAHNEFMAAQTNLRRLMLVDELQILYAEGDRVNYVLDLTPFGREFLSVCLSKLELIDMHEFLTEASGGTFTYDPETDLTPQTMTTTRKH